MDFSFLNVFTDDFLLSGTRLVAGSLKTDFLYPFCAKERCQMGSINQILTGIVPDLSNTSWVGAQCIHWCQLNVKALPRRELKFTAHSSSPLKWTENSS
ncbi:hypothetical protein [Merismopedia glauca]|uniref:hypothetical protein n=1 Tax=Merismopedia glauca TaxID=292586 RepID=UPI0011B266B4|nr:hypothetical protein [Merismopedia glauca]